MFRELGLLMICQIEGVKQSKLDIFILELQMSIYETLFYTGKVREVVKNHLLMGLIEKL